MVWTVGDQIGQTGAMERNRLRSIAFMVKGKHFRPGEVAENMREFDRGCKKISQLRTYKTDKPYDRAEM